MMLHWRIFAIIGILVFWAPSSGSYDLFRPLVAPLSVSHEVGHYIASKVLFSNANETIVFEYYEALPWLICGGRLSHEQRELTPIGSLFGFNASKAIMFSAGHLSNAVVVCSLNQLAKRVRSKTLKGYSYLMSFQFLFDNTYEAVLYLHHGNTQTDHGAMQALSGPYFAYTHLLLMTLTAAKGMTDYWWDLLTK